MGSLRFSLPFCSCGEVREIPEDALASGFLPRHYPTHFLQAHSVGCHGPELIQHFLNTAFRATQYIRFNPVIFFCGLIDFWLIDADLPQAVSHSHKTGGVFSKNPKYLCCSIVYDSTPADATPPPVPGWETPPISALRACKPTGRSPTHETCLFA